MMKREKERQQNNMSLGQSHVEHCVFSFFLSCHVFLILHLFNSVSSVIMYNYMFCQLHSLYIVSKSE